jgi:hypothetical protein
MSFTPFGGVRLTLRAQGAALVAGGPPVVCRLDPPEGATGIFRDALVVASLTHPADPSTLSSSTFRVEEEASVVPARLMLSPDGRAVIWRGRRLLTPNREHRIVICGLRDVHGREVAQRTGWFVPCDLFWIDPSG